MGVDDSCRGVGAVTFIVCVCAGIQRAAHVTVDPFAGDGPVEDPTAAAKRLESETELLVGALDDFHLAQQQRSSTARKLPWHLGQDEDAVTDEIVADDTTLLLAKIATWCEGCIGVVKAMDPTADVPYNRALRGDGVRGDPDATTRDPAAKLSYEDQQRDLDLLLSIWQVGVGGGGVPWRREGVRSVCGVAVGSSGSMPTPLPSPPSSQRPLAVPQALYYAVLCPRCVSVGGTGSGGCGVAGNVRERNCRDPLCMSRGPVLV